MSSSLCYEESTANIPREIWGFSFQPKKHRVVPIYKAMGQAGAFYNLSDLASSEQVFLPKLKSGG